MQEWLAGWRRLMGAETLGKSLQQEEGFLNRAGGDNSPASVNRWSSLPEQICCKTGRTQRRDVVFLKGRGTEVMVLTLRSR